MQSKLLLSIPTEVTFDLKELIKSKKYTQVQLAKRLKMSRKQLNLLLNNPMQLQLGLIIEIANVLEYNCNLQFIPKTTM